MYARFLRRQPPLPHQLRHHGMIVRTLAQHAAAQQVNAAVAHLRQQGRFAVCPQGAERGAHAPAAFVRAGGLQNAGVRLLHGAAQRADAGRYVFGAERLRQRGDRHRGRNLARVVAAHAVADDKQVFARVRRVLVEGAHAADVRPQCKSHGNSSERIIRSFLRGWFLRAP